MPIFNTVYETSDRDRRVVSSCRDVEWTMSGMGLAVKNAADPQPVWWIQDAGDLYLGARLSMSIRDGAPATDAAVVELWAQETRSGSGILAASFTVAALASLPSGELRTLGVVGVPGRSWGVRAKMTSAATRQVMFQITFFSRFIGSGVLWRGEGVT